MPGSEISVGNWSGLIGLAIRDEIDVILSEMDFSANRIDAIKHLMPMLKNKYAVVLSH